MGQLRRRVEPGGSLSQGADWANADKGARAKIATATRKRVITKYSLRKVDIELAAPKRRDREAPHDSARAGVLGAKAAFVDEVRAAGKALVDGVGGGFVVFDDGLVACGRGADPPDGVEKDIVGGDGRGGGGIDYPRVACKVVCDG